MPRYHNINGVRVQFTAEEETARDAEEQAWRDGELDRLLESLRQKRNRLLADTDYFALSDVTLADNMKTYRQQLRDITTQTPSLDDDGNVININWPTIPS